MLEDWEGDNLIIDITMTATRRVDVLKVTLSSFMENLFRGAETRLIINVDPVGDDIDSWEVVDEARKIIPNIVARCPDKPSFGAAFKWVWKESTSEMIFHLEDDWRLLRKVDLSDMLGLMSEFPELVILRLPYSPCVGNTNKSWNKFLGWNGKFYEVAECDRGLLGFAGHPSLIKRKFVDIAINLIDENKNPEKQLKWRVNGIGRRLMNFRYGVYGKPGDGPYVDDIGKNWKRDHGWRKKGSKAYFVEWERV